MTRDATLSGVELRHLRYFVAVAEDLHFGKAARRLGLAQPPLSHQIGQLERLVGQQLFERKPSVRLTAAGEALLPLARSILADVSSSVAAARRAGAGLTGSLTVGFASSVLLGRFPAAIRAFRDRYPTVELKLREIASASQVDALRRGAIDVGVLREPIDDVDCASQTLVAESFVVALPGDHELRNRNRIALSSLWDASFVHFPRDVAPALFDRVIAMCAAAGFVPKVVQEAREWLTIVGLVDAGLGVAIVPASFRGLQWAAVRYVPLEDSAETPVVVAWRKGESNPAVTNFLAELRA